MKNALPINPKGLLGYTFVSCFFVVFLWWDLLNFIPLNRKNKSVAKQALNLYLYHYPCHNNLQKKCLENSKKIKKRKKKLKNDFFF